jgi:hypothetical protein
VGTTGAKVKNKISNLCPLTGCSGISKHERYIDDSLGRKGLFAAGLEIIPVLGDHRSMIRENNQALAQKITEVLGRY